MKETSGEGFGILMLLLDVSAAAQMDLRVKQVIPAASARTRAIRESSRHFAEDWKLNFHFRNSLPQLQQNQISATHTHIYVGARSFERTQKPRT
jgi:hypothetical protein